jgi:diguanylate cyclase
MQVLLIEVFFAAVVAAAGLLGGCWLCRRAARHDSTLDAERRQAREILGRLQDLAVHMAANVDEHGSQVEAINQELTSPDGRESKTVVSAVTKLIQANQRLQKQLTSAEEKLHEQARLVEVHAVEARTDALTGLANRRALDDEIARRWAEFQRYGRRFALVSVDIDHFKRFNDQNGHQAGDEVLSGVGRVLRQTARETDLVGRWGGEEFAIILPESTVAEAARFAQRACQAVEVACFRHQTAELRVTISLGAAELQPAEDAPSLIRRADAAMYASKEAGRNCGHWHDGQNMHPIRADQAETTETPAPPAETRLDDATPAPAGSPAGPVVPAHTDAHREPAKTLAGREEFRLALGRRLAEWRRGGLAPSVLLIRIDSFREITTRWGNEGSGLAFRATAQFLAAAIREMDMVAHYHLGTFAVLLPGAGLAALIASAERLRQVIARCSLPVRDGPLQFTISIAGAVTSKSDEAGTLLLRAEEALDTATKAGGNRSMFHNGQWSETVGAALERACAATM